MEFKMNSTTHSRLFCQFKFYQHQRTTLPQLNDGIYRPHLVIKGTQEYLGVKCITGELDVEFEQNIWVEIELVYDIDYSLLLTNTAFWIMEGGICVGEGIVLT